jgi:hypothetical protein
LAKFVAMKNFYLIIAFVASVSTVFAQKAPLPVEVMAGNNRANLLIIINRPIDAAGKFNFFNVTVGAADYQNTPSETEMIINNSITYGLGKGFSAASGLQWHYKLGFVPTVGFQFLKASPDYLIVVFPTLNFKPGHAFETVALAEYKPKLSEKIRLYTRLQGLLVRDIEVGTHARSGLTLRAGLTFDKFTVGLGSNFDAYGPMKFEKSNHGLFLQMRL